ncbi:hypothetical protein [Hymenobacter cellulosilyticus]|uniref:Uncharacterized protein n=1 Tax=Hymenobacter cellulosilyticus TaxID=2932248 RepID=A0A8T9QDG5_9BACT|nr:hypothetical protein [Hymenobacter cellulosilyticus]UOQ75275.1 hypothetical protein MUN79_29225 [Hymenobacter cellulosilyticus]
MVIRRVEQGFSRPDKRELLRFDDGVDNLSNARELELDRHVYIQARTRSRCAGTGLTWLGAKSGRTCRVGSVSAADSGQQRTGRARHASDQPLKSAPPTEQENMIGRYKKDSLPLSKESTGRAG